MAETGMAERVEPEPTEPKPVAKPPRVTANFLKDREIFTDRFLVIGSYLVLAFWVTLDLWTVTRSALADEPKDQALFEWFLAHTANAIRHGNNPLHSEAMNAPDGLNLMINTPVIPLGIVYAPITWLAGAHVSFILAVTVNLLATALAWYYVLGRLGVESRLARWIGGLFCGFAPGMISQSNGHLNFTAAFIVPLLILATVRLTQIRWGESGETLAAVRYGAWLGLGVVLQVFLGEEIALFTALCCGIFVLAYALLRWDRARQAARGLALGLGVALVIALALLAYPLYVQFFGPDRSFGVPFIRELFRADVAAYLTWSRRSIIGTVEGSNAVGGGATEENSFYGFPLVMLTIGLVIWMWRSTAVKALAVVGALAAICSWGEQPTWRGKPAPFHGLWKTISEWPLLDSVLPVRLALILIPVIGILLALAADRVAAGPPGARRAWWLAFAIALVPLTPTPLPAKTEPQIPTFITSGHYQRYVAPGRTLVPVPVPKWEDYQGIRWASAAQTQFRIPAGYFQTAYPPLHKAQIGVYPRATADLLAKIAAGGPIPQITDVERQQAREDLRFWKADCVVLADTPNMTSLLIAVTDLLGPGQRVDDVWVWDV